MLSSLPSILCLLALLLLGVAADGEMKYWLDETCLHFPLGQGHELSLRPYLKEMFTMARLAYNRMQNPITSTDYRDEQFRNVFRHIFKLDMDPEKTQTYKYSQDYLDFIGLDDDDEGAKDTAFNMVASTLRNMATDWEETSDRLQADNRIYCDNGKHYAHRQGGDLFGDRANNVVSPVNCGPGDGKAEGAKDTLWAFVACDPWDTTVPDDEQPCAVTVCNKALESFRYSGFDNTPAVSRPFLLSELAAADQIRAGLYFDDQAGLAALLFHEWTHTQPYLLEDWVLGGNVETGSTAEWECIRDIPDTARAVINAEAMSYIGLAAMLLEGNANGDVFVLDDNFETAERQTKPLTGSFWNAKTGPKPEPEPVSRPDTDGGAGDKGAHEAVPENTPLPRRIRAKLA